MSSEVILILGGSGKTGRRVAERLLAKGRGRPAGVTIHGSRVRLDRSVGLGSSA